MKMNLNNFSVTVVFGFMFFALTKAIVCTIELQEDNGCEAYVATSNGSNICYIHYVNMSDFSVRKNISLTKAIFDIRKISFTGRPKNRDTNIIESIGATWTRIEENEPNAYTIGNTTINVPESFTRYKVYIWILGSVIFTNESTCFSESLNTTATQSTDSTYMTTTQSTDSTYMTTTQSAHTTYMATTQSSESNHTQTIHPSEGEAAAGLFQQWWLYVIIGILLTIVLILVVITALQMRRNKLNADDTMTLSLRNGDASTLTIHPGEPQIPDFYGNGGTFEKNASAEEHIYEESEMYNIPHIYENGKEVPSDLGTRRGSSHESENSLYGCITGRDFPA